MHAELTRQGPQPSRTFCAVLFGQDARDPHPIDLHEAVDEVAVVGGIGEDRDGATGAGRAVHSQPGDSVRHVPAGDHIVRQGDEGVEMFVIQSGTVEIARNRDGSRHVVTTLGPTEFFGEMSLLESLPRDADAVAVTDVSLLVITQGGLLLRLRRDPTFGLQMLHNLSQRIRRLNAELEAPQ